MSAANAREPIAVVGAGPTGLVAALALRSKGLDVTLFEAEPEDRIRPGSRAIFLFRETLDTLDQVVPGLAGQLIAASNQWASLLTTYRGKVVYQKTFAPSPPGRYGASISQREQEKMLLRHAEELGVRIRWGSPVEGVKTTAQGVTVTLADGSSIRTPYLIAADGARSAVRKSLGIDMVGDSSSSAFVIVDVAEFPGAPVSLQRAFHYRNPALGGRNVLLLPFKNGWRIDLQCRDAEEATRFQNEANVRQWLPKLMDARYADHISWISTYRFHRLVARELTDEHHRVMLIGEAAHLFPPFGGGRGLNSGVQDAVTAAEAIRVSLAGGPDAKRAIEEAAAVRIHAARVNRDAAGTALAHMEARTVTERIKQAIAAALAPRVKVAGKWLDRGAFGPSDPVSATSRF